MDRDYFNWLRVHGAKKSFSAGSMVQYVFAKPAIYQWLLFLDTSGIFKYNIIKIIM